MHTTAHSKDNNFVLFHYSRLGRGTGASPACSMQSHSLAQKAARQTAEPMEVGSPGGRGGVVDLSDFAAPRPPTQNGGVATNGTGSPRRGAAAGPSALGRVPEDEDNIPGAKEIRSGVNGNARHHHSHKKTSAVTVNAPAQKTSPAVTAAGAGTTKNGPRRLADTKPCSYPNLLITKTNDPAAPSSNSRHHHHNGHPSAGNLAAMQDAKLLNGSSQNSSGAGSIKAKASPNSHHYAHNNAHHNHHGQNPAAYNGEHKEGKCSIM